MTKRHLVLPVLAVSCVLVGFSIGRAQQQPPPPAMWYVTNYQVDFRSLDSLRKMLRAYTLPAVEEAKKSGNLLDEKWLFHDTGTEYNVLQLRKFRNWAAIRSDTSFRDALRKLTPDSTRRSTINSAFTGIFQAAPHRDAIYVEVLP